MGNKIFSPGEIVEESGIYPLVGPNGAYKGHEVTVVEGEPFPPAPEKGWGYGKPRTTAHHSDDDAIKVFSAPALPANRPVFKGNSALVPSNNLPNHRPILTGTKQVASFDHLPLHRPVFHSDLYVVAMHGDRPVLRLNSTLVPSPSLPNNRPIAIERPSQNEKLMGYID